MPPFRAETCDIKIKTAAHSGMPGCDNTTSLRRNDASKPTNKMNFFDNVFNFSGDFVQMLIRFAVCLAFNWFIVDRLYYPKSKRRDFYFTFTLISVAIFLLVYFMIFSFEDMKAKTSMGIGIGLFGIFSIMRYRTDAMPVREMTYLFLIIALSVINAIATSTALAEILIVNAMVAAATWTCEHRLKVQPSKLIQYDRIQLITPERRDELVEDLKRRTGLEITKVEVGAIDFLKDMAMLRVYYHSGGRLCSNSVDNKTHLVREDLVSVS